jgi:hypothetical protein
MHSSPTFSKTFFSRSSYSANRAIFFRAAALCRSAGGSRAGDLGHRLALTAHGMRCASDSR